MKGILTFNLPEDEMEFRMAQDGGKYKAVIQDLDEHMRSVVKHTEKPEEYKNACADMRTIMWDMVRDYGLEIWIES